MTVLHRPVRRETAIVHRGRALVIAVHPRHIEIREKGRRDVLSVSYDVLYDFALKFRFRQQQAEKRESKKRRSR